VNPIVTIAIPVFNRQNMVAGAIASALRQGIDDMEILVIDNCSTDRTWEVIQAFNDPRVRCLRNSSNLGLFGNFNRLREQARGRYVRFLCSDDRLTQGCIAREVQLMEWNPSAALLNTRGTLVTSEEQPLCYVGGLLPEGLYSGKDLVQYTLCSIASQGANPFNFPSGILLRKSAMDMAGAFDGSLNGLADVDLWIRMLEHGDLLMKADLGCDILEHGNRESYPLFYSGRFIRGQLDLLAKHGSKLEPEDYEQAKRALSGRCLWYVLKCLSRAKWGAAWIHLTVLREYRPPLGVAFQTLLALVGARLLKQPCSLPEKFRSRLQRREPEEVPTTTAVPTHSPSSSSSTPRNLRYLRM